MVLNLNLDQALLTHENESHLSVGALLHVAGGDFRIVSLLQCICSPGLRRKKEGRESRVQVLT